MNIFHGLLFQSGHIFDPKLAMRLGREREARGQVASEPPPQKPTRPRPMRSLRWLLEELVLLGGRPVSKHHVDDLEEPFPPLHPCP
ncbi:MAG TPA: hypothetical protein VK753_00515 [Xanthomonadaceae bacterium]|nr:hypothetical protein [Xanthomonadaceae bacterium]